MNRRLALRTIFLLLITFLLTYIFIHYDFYIFFVDKQKAITFVNSFHPYDEVVFILLQILQVVAAPIPGEVTGLIGGYLYGPILGTVYSTIGLTIGSWLAFIIARFFGMPLVERVVTSDVLKKFDHFMEHRGILVSFFLFLIPGFPKDCLCYIMGVSHMPSWIFIVISTIGRLLGTVMLTMTGSCVRNGQYHALFIIIGVSTVVFAAAYLHRDKLLERLKRKTA
jgi:uncharacterized membrane protein YdjX (TVP38/TMEM64 family)